MKKEIYELIESSEGLRIFEIQELLEINKVDLNDVLDSSDDFVQDSSYRWHLKDSEYIDKSKGKETLEPKLEGVESDIANYYLSCLAKEDAGKVQFWAESKYDDYDYFEIDSLENVDGEWNLNEAFKAASQKNNKQRFKKQLYLAYPLNLSITPKGTKIVEPLFLIPFEDGTLNDLFTSINQSVFRNYSQGSASDISAEIREITNDLKIGDIHVMPRIDEISSKIYSIKSDWNWKEKIDANNLTSGNIRNKDEAGIYNKAAVVLVNKSMYTFGLSSELETLRNQKLENENALSDWLDLSFVDSKTSDDDPIIEPLEMNLEQREAVKSALNKKLTVITGPPGTGKSQVVTNILVNASLRGKRVLFASKNNKAVDVVHARANGICDKEFVNRLGNNYESNLSVQINKILSLQGNKNEIMDEFELMEANYKDMLKEKVHIDKSLDEIRKIRNKVSATNKDYKEIFEEYDKKTLDTFFKNKTELLSIWDNYVEKVRLSKKENHDLFREIFWSFFEEKRLSEKNSAREEIINFLNKISASPELIKTFNKSNNAFREELIKIYDSQKIKNEYEKLLGKLRETDITALQKKLHDNQKDISEISGRYWNAWLKKLPFTITKKQKEAIGEAASLLEIITQKREDKERVTTEQRRYVQMFPEITKVLSAWAVSSLSVRNRVPFEAGFFDLLVIDEASQCDIASAVPLLYRAKNVVVIGDSNQLKHITGLNAGTNKILMDQYDLIDRGKVNWSYTTNSLFDLASRICPSESLVMLKDHHRSRSEIINFSNKHFYDEQLRVATNYQKLKIPDREEPALRWIDVKGDVDQVDGRGAFNTKEIQAVVNEIKRIVIQQNYSGSLGVVTPFRRQADRINDAVERDSELSPKISQMDFLSDTAHGFQGDERDIIIFSTVINNKSNDSLERFLRSQPHLFNVALTRARSCLIVVGDKNFAEKCSINYLSSFSEYVDKVNQEKSENYSKASEGELISDASVIISDYEKEFFKKLKENGLNPFTQYPVDKYKLDFAFIQGEKKLNVEIDGEEYHRNWSGERLRRDIIRNHRLIEDGWDIIRIWVYELEDHSGEYIEKIRKYLKK